MAEPNKGILSKEERIRSFLRPAAVGDASHDFSGTRADGNVFSRIFRDFKDVGTPDLTPPDPAETALSEFEILNTFLNFYPDPKNPKKSMIETFRDTFLKDEPGPIREFFRWAEDQKQNTPYKVVARRVATRSQKESDDSRDYNWQLTSTELYDFMRGANPDLNFTIDATNVPFYDLLLATTPGRPSQKPANYIYMRESINDAASKTNIAYKADADIMIQTKEDVAPYNVMYPSIKETTATALNKLSEQEMFYSDYNLALSGIDTKDKQPPVVTLTLYNNQFTQKVQIVKGRKEDAHPNAVPTLAKRITALESALRPSGDMKKKMEYFTALQQKRSGDWLQALGCLQPERFGLSPSSRISLVTLDKICVAYGLFAGIDVIMTYYLEKRDGTPNEYWMIRFQRDFQLPPKSLKDQLRDEILAFPNPNIREAYPVCKFEKSAECPGVPTNDYDLIKKQYTCEYFERNKKLGENVSAAMQSIEAYILPHIGNPPRFSSIEGPLHAHIKTLLMHLTTLAVFRSVAQQVISLNPDVDESSVYTLMTTTWANPAYTPSDADLQTVKTLFSVYKKNYMLLSSVLHSKKDQALDVKTIINSVFDKIVANKAGIISLIDSLALFGKTFSKANGGTNGIGIFSFMKNYIQIVEAKNIHFLLQKCSTILLDKSKQKDFDDFIYTINLLFDISGIQPAIPTFNLIETIHEISKGGPVAQQGGSKRRSEEQLDLLEASDFSAATTILAKRYGETLGESGMKVFKSLRRFGGLGSRAVSSKSKSPSRRSYKKSQIKYIHNPYITLYFFLRELSYRIRNEEVALNRASQTGEPHEGYTMQYCITLSIFIKSAIRYWETLSQVPGPKEILVVREYLYFTSIESFLLGYVLVVNPAFPVSRHFMKEMRDAYLMGYFNINLNTDAKLSAFFRTLSNRFVLNQADLAKIYEVAATTLYDSNTPLMEFLVQKIKALDTSLVRHLYPVAVLGTRKRTPQGPILTGTKRVYGNISLRTASPEGSSSGLGKPRSAKRARKTKRTSKSASSVKSNGIVRQKIASRLVPVATRRGSRLPSKLGSRRGSKFKAPINPVPKAVLGQRALATVMEFE